MQKMNLTDIQNKITTIISSSIWKRIFYWNQITGLIGELKAVFENTASENEKMQLDQKNLAEKINNLEAEYKTEKNIKEKLETEIAILKNKIDLLSPLELKNTELMTELNKFKQDEKAKNAQRDSVISKYEQFENNAREREEKREHAEESMREEEKEKLKRSWQDHENNVNKHIKFICQEQSITFIEDWHHDKKPDNVIKISNEYIVFDAKSPRNDDLDNFPNYIKTQVSSLSKYADHKDVKKMDRFIRGHFSDSHMSPFLYLFLPEKLGGVRRTYWVVSFK